MPYRITGTLKLPSGVVAAGVDIKFRALKSFSPLIEQAEIAVRTDSAGKYDVSLEFNTYVCEVTFSTNRPFNAGQFTVAADTVAGQDLPTLLQQAGWTPATPEWIVQIQTWLAEANASAAAADRSAKAAKVSETNSKASETSASSSASSALSSKNASKTSETNAATSASQASASASQASASASQASTSANRASTSETNSATSASAAAQSQTLAKTSETTALAAADRAEQAAQTVVGALVDGGAYNPSSGQLPTPVMSGSKKLSTIWKVTGTGLVGGIDLGSGDSLIYTSRDNSYYKIDNTESVSKVNNKTGVVVLSATDVGADPSGTASSALTAHAAKTSAHPISGVAGLEVALNDLTARLGELELWPQFGSNANGDWVKYEDGTMICTFSGTINISIPNAYGVLYQNLTDPFTFPATFIAPPVVTVGEMRWLGMVSWGTVAGTPTKTQVILRILDVGQRAVGPTNVSYTAVGRWK